MGEEAYVAVVTALKELHETNPNSSEKSLVPEVWNFKTGRRATLVEVMDYIVNRVIKKR